MQCERIFLLENMEMVKNKGKDNIKLKLLTCEISLMSFLMEQLIFLRKFLLL